MLNTLRNRLHGEEGFTLIELLVVILIIGILAAIAIPSFLNQKGKGEDAQAKSSVRSAQTAMYVMADGLMRLLAPVLSFTCDEAWQHLPGKRTESVHMTVFPTSDELQRLFDEAGVKYDTPVTLKLKAVTVRTVLKMVLRDLGLTYVIKDEMIQVTTPDKAKDMMIIKVYSIADLVRNRFEAAMLIDLIQTTIEPQSWRANGGTATLMYNPVTLSLVNKHTAAFHAALGSIFP